MASADAYIIGDIFHRNWVGIIRGDISNGSLYIAAGRIGLFHFAGMFHKKSQGTVQPPCHFHRIYKPVPAPDGDSPVYITHPGTP